MLGKYSSPVLRIPELLEIQASLSPLEVDTSHDLKVSNQKDPTTLQRPNMNHKKENQLIVHPVKFKRIDTKKWWALGKIRISLKVEKGVPFILIEEIIWPT